MEPVKPAIQGSSGDRSNSLDVAGTDNRIQLTEKAPGAVPELSGPPAANRHRLEDERSAITHHFAFGGHEGYLTVGLYPNGQPGEIFIRMAKAGSTIAGLMECFGTVVSVSLQHGVPLKVLCEKLSHTRFEPSGWTGNGAIEWRKAIEEYDHKEAASPNNPRFPAAQVGTIFDKLVGGLRTFKRHFLLDDILEGHL